MARTGTITVLLAGTMISSCATITRQCDKLDQIGSVHGRTYVSAPEGCQFVGEETRAVRSFTCENGRQGVMVINVANDITATGGA